MRRREFIELFGGALMAWPLPAQAQRGKISRIGIIDNAPVWDSFRKGLRDLGYVEGQNIAFEYRTTDGIPSGWPRRRRNLCAFRSTSSRRSARRPRAPRSRRPRPFPS